MGAGDFGKDVFHIGGPYKRLGVFVMRLDERIDRRFELRYAPETPAPDPFGRDLPKPSFDNVQPRTGGGREMDMKTRMPSQPRFDLRVFVRAVVINNQVQIQVRRRLGV